MKINGTTFNPVTSYISYVLSISQQPIQKNQHLIKLQIYICCVKNIHCCNFVHCDFFLHGQALYFTLAALFSTYLALFVVQAWQFFYLVAL